MGKYSVRRRGRAPMWQPGVFTNGDDIFREELRERWKKRMAARIQVWTQYREFCDINDCDPLRDTSAELILAQWRNSKLQPSSIRTKFRHLRSSILRARRGEALDQGQNLIDLLSDVNLQAARHRSGHAKDFKVEVLEEAIMRECTSESDEELQRKYAAMLLCGLRGSDFLEVASGELRVSGNRCSLDVNVSKNHRSPDCRAVLNLTDKMKGLWRERLIPCLRGRTLQFSKGDFDVRTVRGFFKARGISGVSAYTLRRSYCHRAIEFCTDSSGKIDWLAATRLTLHKNVKSLMAAYSMKARDHFENSSSESESGSSSSLD